MSIRVELEDKFTVVCRNRKCRSEFIDPGKRPNQKFLVGTCPHCGYTNMPGYNVSPRSEFQARCIARAERKPATSSHD